MDVSTHTAGRPPLRRIAKNRAFGRLTHIGAPRSIPVNANATPMCRNVNITRAQTSACPTRQRQPAPSRNGKFTSHLAFPLPDTHHRAICARWNPSSLAPRTSSQFLANNRTLETERARPKQSVTNRTV